MNKNQKFPLSHFVLYAKGWYKQTDNVWDDLIEILKLDNYSPFDSSDVYNIIVQCFSNFDTRESNLREVLFAIGETNCWKTGYYTKGNAEWSNKPKEELPDYNMPTAFIHYVLSTFRFMSTDKWVVAIPKYKKYPKNPSITLKKVIDNFNK